MHIGIRGLGIALAAAPLLAAGATRAGGVAEHVTGGTLDLAWESAFGLPLNSFGVTLDAADPAYANPSGDHTVLEAITTQPFEGGLNLSVTDPGAVADYRWEAWMFTGDGSTRRGLVVRATGDPGNRDDGYQFVIEAGLLQVGFRRLVGQVPTTLASWFTTDTPSGFPGQNAWVHLAVEAVGPTFRCWYNGYELTQGVPIVDAMLPEGWVGMYAFNFQVGGVAIRYDDLVLEPLGTVALAPTTWAGVKGLYR